MPAMVDGKIDLRKHFPAWICEVALLFRVESGKGCSVEAPGWQPWRRAWEPSRAGGYSNYVLLAGCPALNLPCKKKNSCIPFRDEVGINE